MAGLLVGGLIRVYLEKSMSFGGHPPEKMDIRTGRNLMGCAYRREDDRLTLASFGEWSNFEGGARVRLLVEVPETAKVVTSNEDAGGFPSSLSTGPFWYSATAPRQGWSRLADRADPDMTALEPSSGIRQCWSKQLWSEAADLLERHPECDIPLLDRVSIFQATGRTQHAQWLSRTLRGVGLHPMLEGQLSVVRGESQNPYDCAARQVLAQLPASDREAMRADLKAIYAALGTGKPAESTLQRVRQVVGRLEPTRDPLVAVLREAGEGILDNVQWDGLNLSFLGGMRRVVGRLRRWVVKLATLVS